MGMGAGGGGGTASTPNYKSVEKKLPAALVVKDIEIIEEKRVIEIPVIKEIEKEQIVYRNKEEEQTKFNTKEETTIKYVPKEEETVRYKTVEHETVKYVTKEVECERPKPVDKLYERPVIREKEYELVTFKDLEAITKAMDLIPKLVTMVEALQNKLESLYDYKLVEKEIKVPQITYVPTPVERIVWKDVSRERVT